MELIEAHAKIDYYFKTKFWFLYWKMMLLFTSCIFAISMIFNYGLLKLLDLSWVFGYTAANRKAGSVAGGLG